MYYVVRQAPLVEDRGVVGATYFLTPSAFPAAVGGPRVGGHGLRLLIRHDRPAPNRQLTLAGT